MEIPIYLPWNHWPWLPVELAAVYPLGVPLHLGVGRDVALRGLYEAFADKAWHYASAPTWRLDGAGWRFGGVEFFGCDAFPGLASVNYRDNTLLLDGSYLCDAQALEVVCLAYPA
jgi:hypothetical protein